MSRAVELSAEGPPEAVIDVIVGIVRDSGNRVLIGRRQSGKHMAGSWEFPGGKLHPGESPAEGLKRELNEELGIVVDLAEPFMKQAFDYPDRSVRLDVWWVFEYEGDVEPLEGQSLRWIEPAELAHADLLPAEAPIVGAILERLG